MQHKTYNIIFRHLSKSDEAALKGAFLHIIHIWVPTVESDCIRDWSLYFYYLVRSCRTISSLILPTVIASCCAMADPNRTKLCLFIDLFSSVWLYCCFQSQQYQSWLRFLITRLLRCMISLSAMNIIHLFRSNNKQRICMDTYQCPKTQMRNWKSKE